MVISVTPPALPSAAPLASEPVMLTVPKLASGRMPPLAVQHGASTITSAEDRGAFARVPVWVWLQPWVVSEMTRLEWLLPVSVTEALKWSPGRSGLEYETGAAGYFW